MPMLPVTRRDMVGLLVPGYWLLVRAGKLADLHAGAGDGIEAAGGETLIPREEAIDGIVLFDIAALELQVHDHAIVGGGEFCLRFVRRVGERAVSGDQLQLKLARRLVDV